MGSSKAGPKVLVVDDIRVIRELLAKYLDRLGFATCVASDGQEALEVVQSEQPDLLISDVRMPHMNGYELTRQVREISNIPIVIMTAGSDHLENDREAAIDAGADAFYIKGDLAELLVEVKVLLARTEPGGE